MTFKSLSKIRPEYRQLYAQSISGLLNWAMDSRRIPYMPNNENDFWTVDLSNDWKLKFLEDGFSFEIYHRYEAADDVKEQMRILSEWLVARFGFAHLK